MSTITAQAVKDLREKTGAGMMDCRRALEASNGNLELAVDHLRKTGIAKLEKKSSRTTKEGRVAVHIAGNVGALVEVLCETDFVAKNERYQQYVRNLVVRIAETLTAQGDVAEIVREGEKQAIGELVGSIGENIQIRRAARWVTPGSLASYIHMGGKIGVLVEAEGESTPALLTDICMHVAAFSPRYVDPEGVPADVVAKEKEIAAAQVQDKPANMIEKIVLGKVGKWYTEVCLTRQPWLRDDKTSLQKVAPKLKVKRFLRWQVGEEI